MPEDDDDLTSVQSRVLDLAQFIGAPLVAVVEADAMAADTFRRFLEQVAFEPDDGDDDAPEDGEDDGDETEEMAADAAREAEVRRVLGGTGRRLGRLRYVSFSYDHVQNGRRVTSVVKVPLLSLIPLPALQVKEARFDWTLDIISSRRSAGPMPALRRTGSRVGPSASVLPASMREQRRLLCAISPSADGAKTGGPDGGDSRQSTTKAHMRVQVTMESADMPAGLGTLLNVMSQGTNGVTLTDPDVPDEDDDDTDREDGGATGPDDRDGGGGRGGRTGGPGGKWPADRKPIRTKR